MPDPEFAKDVEWSLEQPSQPLTENEQRELAELEELYRRLGLYAWWVPKKQ